MIKPSGSDGQKRWWITIVCGLTLIFVLAGMHSPVVHAGADTSQKIPRKSLVAYGVHHGILTATNNSTFVSSSGACSGTDACPVTMNAAQNVTTTFSPLTGMTIREYLDSSVQSTNVAGIIGSPMALLDFGGVDTYTLLPTLAGPVHITDNQASTINLPVGLTVDAVEFVANGVRFTINGHTVTMIGAPTQFTFVFAGSPLDLSAGIPRSFAETATAFGTTLPEAGQPPVAGTITGTIQANGDIGKPNSSVFNVDLAPGVQLVPENELRNVILMYNQDERAYLLNPDSLARLGIQLNIDDPLILAGVEIGRITILETDPDGIYVETQMIPLNEVFPNGEIAWDYGVEFSPNSVQSLVIEGVGKFSVASTTPITIIFEQGGFNYELQVTLGGSTAEFNFTVTKGVGAGIKAKFEAKGQINRFRNKNHLKFASGQLLSNEFGLNGIRGHTDLKLIVAGSGNDFFDVKLPVPIIKIPFIVGYIPAVLSISAQFTANAVVPLEGSSQVALGFDYDSDLGFTYNGTTVESGGRLGNITFGDPLHMTGAASAIGVTFGIGFPRISLHLAGGLLVPWAQTAFLIGGSYTFMPACQSADALFLGAAGYDLGILGFELAKGNKTLFMEKKELLRAGQCPLEQKGSDPSLFAGGIQTR